MVMARQNLAHSNTNGPRMMINVTRGTLVGSLACMHKEDGALGMVLKAAKSIHVVVAS